MRPEDPLRSWRWVALVVVAVAAVALLVALVPMLRAFAALVLIFLPIYLISWPLLRPRIGAAGAFTMAGGLSIAMVAIAGLVLNLLPWGLQAATWLGLVAVLLAIGVALGRRPWTWRPTPAAASYEVVLVAVGGVLVIAALAFAQIFAASPAESFTQLWIAPSTTAPGSSVEIHVRNDEQAATDYRVELLRNGALVQSWDRIHLAAGATWTETAAAGTGRVEARLYRASDPLRVYRYVTVRLGPTPQPSASGQA